jgi:hypothetical protein
MYMLLKLQPRTSHNLLSIFLFAFLFLMSGCDKGFSILGDCFTESPEEAELEIKVTLDDQNRRIPIRIYKGYYENGDLLSVDTVAVDPFHFTVPVNQYYTVVAEYKKGNRIIHAVDGSKLKVSSSNQEDGSVCYQIGGDKLNVRLAY